MRLPILILSVTIILGSCAASKSSSILYNDDYNASKDQTTVTLFPYGLVNLPGQWKKIKYDQVSKQHFFTGPDSVVLALSINPASKFDFYKPGMDSLDFLKAYYTWESDYFQKEVKATSRIIKEEKDRNYMVWSLETPSGLPHFYLYGMKGQSVYNLYLSTHKWDENRVVAFLEKSYLQ